MKALAIGGVFDHLHAMLSLPATTQIEYDPRYVFR